MRNPRHSQSLRARRATYLLWVGYASCTPAAEERDRSSPEGTVAAAEAAAPRVRAGVDILLMDSLSLVRGRSVGLLTNQTGVHVGPDGPVSTILALHRRDDFELVALFSPEHGLTGQADAGERVPLPTDAHDETGLPIYSLYTDTRRPLPHMLEGIEVLLFDVQDVGARYYTYQSTMALAMAAAGEAGIPFVVLDRPVPIGGDLVQGNVLDPAFATFVGMYPVPMRHGMTTGELARLFVGEFGVEVELSVVPMAGWTRDTWYDETGMPWVAPSPNLPTLQSAIHYPGTCLFEGTNLSVGRGTEQPFEWVGAPWLDGSELARRLNAYVLDGVRFEPTSFQPSSPGDGKWSGTLSHGVRFVVTDRAVYNPTRAGVAALIEARRLSGNHWEWNASHFDGLAGTDRLRLQIEEGADLATLAAGWQAPLERFQRLREPYLLYP